MSGTCVGCAETGAADGEVTTSEDRDLVATLLQDIFGSVMRSTPALGTGG